MALERLLSLVRRAAPGKCTAERVIAAGYLSQIQAKHLNAGGHDCRKLTRKRVIADGAPIRASIKRSLRTTGPRRRGAAPSTAWINKEMAAHRAVHGRSTRQQYLEVLEGVRGQWNDLPDIDKQKAAQSRAVVAEVFRSIDAADTKRRML